MKDIQNLRDHRRINIRKVGVKDISYPITVLDRERKLQQTVATVNMYVNLPHRFKGTHMSRFIEILNRFHGAFNLKTFQAILEEMKGRLDAQAAHLEICFPYFFQNPDRHPPAGGERYLCRLHGSLEEELDLIMELDIPVPLSPPIPGGGSLQPGVWATARTTVRLEHFLWIEDLIGLIEHTLRQQCAGEVAVDQVCRRLSRALAENPAIGWYKVVVESLANGYAAFASAERSGSPRQPAE